VRFSVRTPPSRTIHALSTVLSHEQSHLFGGACHAIHALDFVWRSRRGAHHRRRVGSRIAVGRGAGRRSNDSVQGRHDIGIERSWRMLGARWRGCEGLQGGAHRGGAKSTGVECHLRRRNHQQRRTRCLLPSWWGCRRDSSSADAQRNHLAVATPVGSGAVSGENPERSKVEGIHDPWLGSRRGQQSRGRDRPVQRRSVLARKASARRLLATRWRVEVDDELTLAFICGSADGVRWRIPQPRPTARGTP